MARSGGLPDERIVGLSEPAGVVEHFSLRPQVQERLTKQVAGLLHLEPRPKGVGVVLEAEHGRVRVTVPLSIRDATIFDGTRPLSVQAITGVSTPRARLRP